MEVGERGVCGWAAEVLCFHLLCCASACDTKMRRDASFPSPRHSPHQRALPQRWALPAHVAHTALTVFLINYLVRHAGWISPPDGKPADPPAVVLRVRALSSAPRAAVSVSLAPFLLPQAVAFIDLTWAGTMAGWASLGFSGHWALGVSDRGGVAQPAQLRTDASAAPARSRGGWPGCGCG